MNKYYVANVSGGKDSVAMFLMLYAWKRQIDEVVFFDTGWEFDSIYENMKHIEHMCDLKGIKFTRLYPSQSFEHFAFEHIHKNRKGQIVKGYSWCGGMCRWGTTFKTSTIKKHFQQPEYEDKEIFHYIGLAADEQNRIAKNTDPHKIYPLAELNVTEKEALEICKLNRYRFEEDGVYLYDILDRVSCWCCGNKNLKELKNYYKYLPRYWEMLKEYQARTDRPFRRDGKTIFDLEERFKKEITDESIQ
jgi:3'-phosphoadenosine 5'-phosphosulfate sulfotransferase (PAPS reductase)/FAD synthetase